MENYQQVDAKNLRAAANAAYHNGQKALLAMFANDERKLNGCYAVYCLFDGPDGQIRGIKAVIAAECDLEFPSLTPIIPAAAWYEREIHDLFGLVPVGHPDLRPLVLHENWPKGLYPLRKDFSLETQPADEKNSYPLPRVRGEGVFEVPVGPIHAGIIEPGHFRFSQAGENIIQLEAKLFFTHRGIEKTLEGLTLSQAIYSIERICGACSVSHALSYVHAVERVAGVEVPRRAQWIRILAAELERIYNHVGDIGNLCAGVGFAVGVSNGARLKEEFMRLNEKISGNRFLRGIVVPGGVSMDITANLIEDIEVLLKAMDTDYKELLQLLQENDAFLNRINHTGKLFRQAALDLGAVGVAARASGVHVDMRRDYPYELYSELDFKAPVYTSGDVAARLWVRADEVLQSVSIIRQVLSAIAPGILKTDIPPIKAYSTGIGWSESARGGNLHWMMVDEENRIYRYFVKSASYSNWPAVAVAVPGNIIPDFPLINKSFELCYACLDR